ncbi:MAG TPA: hypothetical protein VK563_18785 [Puia sp.]|nr:hypothetical protein [Puia sp.]
MKYLFICAGLLAFTSCNSQQSDGKKLAEQIQAVQTALRPGTFPTTEGGWTMTAKVNGKDWAATSLYPPEETSRIVGYYKDAYIGFPYDRRDMVTGKKITFEEGHVADMFIEDGIGTYIGRKGEMEVTKVNDKWAEGKFYFTAVNRNSGKTVEVTNGFFRISLSGK